MEERVWDLIDKTRPWTVNAERTWHHMKRAKLVKDCRERFRIYALEAQIPKLHHIAIEVWPLSPHRKWRPDVGACFPSVKSAIDGIVDAGIIPNDTDEFLGWVRFYPLLKWPHEGLLVRIREEQRWNHPHP